MTAHKLILTLDDAKKIAAGAEAEAKRNGWPVVIAIVDDGGHLLHLQRLDGAQYGSIQVAIEKACAAIAFRRPTKIWEENIAAGHLRYLNLPGTLPIEGGYRLRSTINLPARSVSVVCGRIRMRRLLRPGLMLCCRISKP